MNQSEQHRVLANDPAALPSRAGETIAEVAFAMLLVGTWLVTCLAG
jgi:hypothetical protein